MKTAIIKGLNEQESEEMRQSFVHAAHLRKRIQKLLEEKINASNRIVRSKDSYSIPNWAFLQADAVGYERALTEVISLLDHQPDISTEKVLEDGPTVKRRGRPPKKSPIPS